jgi:hypothetical protein
MTKAAIFRKARHLAMAQTIIRQLCDWLDATTSYHEPETPRTTRPPKWAPFYGSTLEVEGDGLLDASGKPTRMRLVRKFTAEPGEIITMRSGARYAVQPSHALKLISKATTPNHDLKRKKKLSRGIDDSLYRLAAARTEAGKDKEAAIPSSQP